MPRARSHERDEAKEIWLKSKKTIKLKDIAAQLGVPENRVRKWKAEDKWEKGTLPNEKGTKRSAEKGDAPKKRGAPPGNKNAVGHASSVPPGNKHNFKHGIYSEIYWDTLDEDERRMIDDLPNDEEQMLIEQIQLLTVRERRLLKMIAEKKSAQGGLSLDSVTKRTLEIKGNVISENQQKQTETTTKTISSFEVIQKLETELTRVQARKTRCIEALNKLRMERAGERTNELVDDWIFAVMGGAGNE